MYSFVQYLRPHGTGFGLKELEEITSKDLHDAFDDGRLPITLYQRLPGPIRDGRTRPCSKTLRLTCGLLLTIDHSSTSLLPIIVGTTWGTCLAESKVIRTTHVIFGAPFRIQAQILQTAFLIIFLQIQCLLFSSQVLERPS